MGKIIIGIVGQIGAGKDTAASFLKKVGFANFSLSDRIRKELKKQGNPNFTREEIQQMGNKLRKKYGDDYWAQKAWQEANQTNQEKLIISSIRHPAEAEFLKKQKNFYLLAVVANQKLRFQRKRSSTRSDDQDILTWEKFKKLDDYESKGATEHGQKVEKTIDLADFKIKNNGTKEELKEKVYQVLEKIKRGENGKD